MSIRFLADFWVQAMAKVPASMRGKPFWLLVIPSVLGGLALGLKPLALAQDVPPPISVLNMARFYTGLPHQDRALWLLQSQINQMDPELLQADEITANVWRDSEPLVGHLDILEEIPEDELTGTDPLVLAIAQANLRTGAPVKIEMLSGPNLETPDQVMVTVTATGLLDDSVAGIRYRFDIKQQEADTDQEEVDTKQEEVDTDQEEVNTNQEEALWEIRRAGQQIRCHPGRGHQDWSDTPCS